MFAIFTKIKEFFVAKPAAQEPVAPYKIETPAAPVIAPTPTPVTQEVAARMVEVEVVKQPELKVVTGARPPRKPRVRKSPARRAAERAAAEVAKPQAPARKPRAPRKPKNV
jgi:hypothetical protein